MKAIGGYFELELSKGDAMHAEAISLNTGRNALEYIIRARNCKKLYLPLFSCKVLLQPIQRVGIAFEFYNIDSNLEAIFDFKKMQEGDIFLYINYFGLKRNYIQILIEKCRNLVIDNAQAFFDAPFKDVDTLYSARKFFGVPDGAYLYCKKPAPAKLEKSFSFNRFEQLLRRIDVSAEDGYASFIAAENALAELPVGQMSALTQSLLQSIDYDHVAAIRRRNYLYLHNALSRINEFKIDLEHVNIPMVYPFWTFDVNLRRKLIDHKVYVAQYWPNVLEWSKKESVEYKLASNIISLPVDQRIGIEDLDNIIKLIKG